MEKKEPPTFYAKDRASWRQWLVENHQTAQNIWLIYYKKQSGIPTITYDESVDEALCFGWIDSTINTRDEKSSIRFFTKRSPKSNWSRVNKAKIEKLLAANLMTESGLRSIAIAKENGTWTALDGVEALQMPDDLKQAFEQNAIASANFEAFSRSSKRAMLEWLLNAKRPETRQKRIEEIVSKAQENKKAMGG